MAFDPDFLSMMQQQATYYPAASLDNYGKVVVGAGTVIPCHTTYKTVVNYGNTEENQTSNAQLQMPPPGYVVTLPNGDEVTMPTVTNQDQLLLADGTIRHVLWTTMYFDGGAAAGAHHQSLFLD